MGHVKAWVRVISLELLTDFTIQSFCDHKDTTKKLELTAGFILNPGNAFYCPLGFVPIIVGIGDDPFARQEPSMMTYIIDYVIFDSEVFIFGKV